MKWSHPISPVLKHGLRSLQEKRVYEKYKNETKKKNLYTEWKRDCNWWKETKDVVVVWQGQLWSRTSDKRHDWRFSCRTFKQWTCLESWKNHCFLIIVFLVGPESWWTLAVQDEVRGNSDGGPQKWWRANLFSEVAKGTKDSSNRLVAGFFRSFPQERGESDFGW